MDIVGIILVVFLIVCLIVVFAFDPLEKYDKNLDDPDAKKFEGVIRDLKLGPFPRVTDKRKERKKEV